MPTITIGSSKGGCGKSTTAVALASEFKSANTEVCIIDADAQATVDQWYKRRSARTDQTPIPVIYAGDIPRDTEIISIIEEAKKRYAVVIIDVAGIQSQRMQYAISRSDYWIIPQQATSPDASATNALIKNDMVAIETMRGGRPIAHKVLITRTNQLIVSGNAKFVIEETKRAVPTFAQELHQCDALSAMDLYAKTLEEIQTDGDAKADKPRAWAQAIIREMLEDMSTNRKSEAA
jgi:chromosome partitioning protein